MENAEPYDDSNSQAHLVKIAVATAVITLLTFPVLIYTSVIFYGLPAAAYILFGYVVWLVLAKRNRRKGLAFAVGFASVVTSFLLGPLSAKPLYVVMVLLPSACLCLVLKLMRRFR